MEKINKSNNNEVSNSKEIDINEAVSQIIEAESRIDSKYVVFTNHINFFVVYDKLVKIDNNKKMLLKQSKEECAKFIKENETYINELVQELNKESEELKKDIKRVKIKLSSERVKIIKLCNRRITRLEKAGNFDEKERIKIHREFLPKKEYLEKIHIEINEWYKKLLNKINEIVKEYSNCQAKIG